MLFIIFIEIVHYLISVSLVCVLFSVLQLLDLNWIWK